MAKKMLLLLGKLGKHIKFVTSLVYLIDKIPTIFYKLEALRAIKTSACLSCFFRSPWPLSELKTYLPTFEEDVRDGGVDTLNSITLRAADKILLSTLVNRTE